jgi:tRNA nucleotidyltransferase (CCA-adding enzyme)
VEKAVYFGLGAIPIKEYTNIEFTAVGPEASLKEIQERIIEEKLRILPVVEAGKVLGVITRTDLMNILVGGPVIPSFLYESRDSSRYLREKNMAAVLKERLPRRVIGLLKEFGRVADLMGFNAYLVGGLVRDILLKRENLDVDIVIEGDGIKFAQEFATQHEVKVRSHKKFGTVVLVFPDGFKVDVATARIEYYDFPAAPPTVEMSSLKMDLYRRDFTINTLAIKLNRRDYGTLIDYFGALKDIREKAIRVLHNLSFVEDPTRVLRAIRFEQRFGFRIGKLTLALMKNAVAINCFKGLSGRRLFLELKLLLLEQEPIQAIERMDEFDLLQIISTEIRLTADLKFLFEEIRGVLSWFNHLYLEEPYEPWKVYWHGLTSGLDPRALQALGERLQMGDAEGRRMIAQRTELNSALDKLFRSKGESTQYELYRLLSSYDTETLLFMMAKANNRTVKRQISNYFTRLRGAKVSLTGRDLKNMGFRPGPLYRQILDALLEARLNNQVNTRDDELLFVREKYGNPVHA